MSLNKNDSYYINTHTRKKGFPCIFCESEYHYESFSLIIPKGQKMGSIVHSLVEAPNAFSDIGGDEHQFAMPGPSRSIRSETLFSEGNEVYIQHRGEQYLLRHTRNGKLILTK